MSRETCAYIKCNKKSRITVTMNNKNLYLCDEHYRKMLTFLMRIAIARGSGKIDDIKVRREGRKIRFVSRVKVPRTLRKLSCEKHLGLVREYMGSYRRK